MVYNIMTWNTQLYEYGNIIDDTKIVKPLDYVKFNDVVNTIKKHMGKDNSIAVLQEIPLNSNITQSEHIFFTMLCGAFPDKDYNILYNRNITVRNQMKMTIVIGRKGLVEKDDEGINSDTEKYCNCFYSLRIRDLDLQVLAVHQSLKDGGRISDKLSKKEGYRPNIILGDFNAGNYEKKNESAEFVDNRDNFNTLLREYKYTDICKGRVTREWISPKGVVYKTPIDHVLVKESLAQDPFTNYAEPYINETLKLSDHHPITFEIDCRK